MINLDLCCPTLGTTNTWHFHILLAEAEVLSRQTRVTTQKSSNFWSDRWIVLTFLQWLPEAVFLEVAMESILG
jgi:hypothetical protein